MLFYCPIIFYYFEDVIRDSENSHPNIGARLVSADPLKAARDHSLRIEAIAKPARLIIERSRPGAGFVRAASRINYRERIRRISLDERDKHNREIERTHIVGGVVQRKPRLLSTREISIHIHTYTRSMPPQGVCRFLFWSVGIAPLSASAYSRFRRYGTSREREVTLSRKYTLRISACKCARM